MTVTLIVHDDAGDVRVSTAAVAVLEVAARAQVRIGGFTSPLLRTADERAVEELRQLRLVLLEYPADGGYATLHLTDAGRRLLAALELEVL